MKGRILTVKQEAVKKGRYLEIRNKTLVTVQWEGQINSSSLGRVKK